MTRTDWLLLALRFSQVKGLSPIQLQKALFLLGQELPTVVGDEYYHFEALNYGPFDKAVFEDAISLSKSDLIRILPPTKTRAKQYTVAPLGIARTEELLDEAPARGAQYLENVVNWLKDMPVQKLIRSIYHKYPQFKTNSVFQEQYE
jgi:uncharacterized protein